MPTEVRRIRRRLDWLETFVNVLDSQLRTQGLRIELHLEECEPAAHSDMESKVRDAMGPHDARLYQVTRLMHAIAARQDDQATQLADLAKLIGRPAQAHPEENHDDDRPRRSRRMAEGNRCPPG